jgi:predicted amidohydrolase
MKVVALQLDISWENPPANFAKVEQLLSANPPERGALVVLPEMFATGFSMDLAKTCAGPALEAPGFLRRLARQYGVAVLGGISRPAGIVVGAALHGANEALIYNPEGRELACYRKQFPFSGAGEDAVHERGRDVTSFEWAGLHVAPLICYDLRFPEPFRAAARLGAEVFIVIAAWPVARIEHWLTLLRARAIENQGYVIGVNRTGNEPHYQYCGRSIVVDPHGAIVADAGEAEGVMTCTLAAQTVRQWRERFPAYRDFLRWG